MTDTLATLKTSVWKIRPFSLRRPQANTVAATPVAEVVTETPAIICTGYIDRILNGSLEGWVKNTNDDSPLQIDILLDGKVIADDVSANGYRPDLEAAGISHGRFAFNCLVPADAELNGARIELRLTSSQQIILGKTINPQMVQVKPIHVLTPPHTPTPAPMPKAPQPPAYEGRIEKLTDCLLKGWASDSRKPGRVFDIEVLLDGIFLTRLRNDQRRGDLLTHGKSEGLGGIQMDLLLSELEPGKHDLTLVLPDGQKLTQTITLSGNRPRYHLNAGLARISPADTAIIVPIYNADDDVEICIRRLTEYTPQELEVLLIDDASPSPRIATLLAEAERLPGFRVLRNSKNLGFTRTINRGLEEIGRKHAILLNSDARVTPGWAQGMLRAAASRPRVATVTAMSDRAGAFSAPRIGNDNKLPEGVDEITYARAFRRRALGLYPIVPTGNGFCMFVNRECINEVGPLDAEAFPRGYGEENDFCMRAGRAGWSHLIDDRTYVFHDRSKSFGDAKTDLMTAGRQIVDARFPEYKTAIRTFSTGKELAMARFRATQAMDDCKNAQSGHPAILYVVATQTGGTPQTNMDLMQEVADEMAPWLLHCDSRKMTLSRLEGRNLIEIRTHTLSEAVDTLSHRSGEYDAVMRDWLEIVNPRIVHIRHLAWHSLSLPALAKMRGSRIVFSFHDFYAVCPTIKLLDENNVFCGGQCTATGGECTIELWDQSDMPRIKNSWVHVWRERFSKVLQDCDAYVTTSDSARERILTHLKLDPERFFVIPHGRTFSTMEQLRQYPRHGEPVRILVPGNISTAKGLDVITALLEHDRAGLLEFHILGRVPNSANLNKYKRLIMHGGYQRDAFAQKVAQIKPHLGAVLSIWDETYCHTLTELWSVGVPPIVFDFPTVAGRVRASGAGWVVPHEDIVQLYDRIVELSFDRAEQVRADLAILGWQEGHGAGRSTKVMSAAYREVYRHTIGRSGERPMVAVVCPATPQQDRANASTEIRIWERTVNSPERECIFVRMTPHGLLANLRDGIVDGVVLQRNVVPATMVAPLIEEMRKSGVQYVLDLDDDLLDVPEDKDPIGAYASYAPALKSVIESAAIVSVSTETLQRKIAGINTSTVLLPNRHSERLWRGDLPARERDGKVRALYMGSVTHGKDFAMIAPVLEAVASVDPDFRVGIIGVQKEKLPAWAERIDVPDNKKSYAFFVPWLKQLSAGFDLGLAPLTDDPFNQFKSNLKALDYAALGLPVLASDMSVFQSLAGKLPGLKLVKSDPESWRRALTDLIAQIRAGSIDGTAIRAALFADHGLASTLSDFDKMLISVARKVDAEKRSGEVDRTKAYIER